MVRFLWVEKEYLPLAVGLAPPISFWVKGRNDRLYRQVVVITKENILTLLVIFVGVLIFAMFDVLT